MRECAPLLVRGADCSLLMIGRDFGDDDFIKAGANVNTTDEADWAALMHAAQNGSRTDQGGGQCL